jgi:NADH-quinone oxidoreductase E subunit
VSAEISELRIEEPAAWSFTPENRSRIDGIIARYPPGRQASAVLACLDLAQRQHGWVPQAAIEHIAELLALAPIRVAEVASFYTMINRQPLGRYLIQVCGTTPCWLKGSDEIFAVLREETGVARGTDQEGLFTVVEVECLGACVNAPVVQINDDFYEDLDAESLRHILRGLRRGEPPRPGSQIGRHSSEPVGGATTLLSVRE